MRGLTSLITHQDIPVLVAINEKGVHVIDEIQCVSCFLHFFTSLCINLPIFSDCTRGFEIRGIELGIRTTVARRQPRLLALPIFAVYGGGKWSKGIKNPASFL